MKQSVSIIVPAYNVENTIERCIDSLLKQTYKPSEIIVVDDGSTDSTGTILDKYALMYEYIRVIHQNNAGVSAARNKGLDEASSDSILFVDSDDYVGDKYVDTLMKYSEFDFVTCGFHLQNPMLIWEEIVFVDEVQLMDVIRKHPSEYMGNYYFGSPWAKLYKLAILNQNKLRFATNIHIGEDILFNFQYMFFAKTIRIVPMCDYYYYYQKSSLSHAAQSDSWKWEIIREEVIKKFFNSTSFEEIQYLRQREFEILKNILIINSKDWTGEQIRGIYTEQLFQECIQFKRENGSYEDRFLIFALDHNMYKIYYCFRSFKSYFRRGINHFKRKLKLS